MSDWKEVLSKVAPTMAGALGGPFAGIAANTICSVLTGKSVKQASTEMVQDLIESSDPEALLKLKEADNTFKVQMKKLDVEDRKSARDMAVKTSILPQIILSSIYTVGYFWLLFSFINGDVVIAESVKSEFNMVLGVLTAAQIQIMNFWFGSSSGSKEKNGKLKQDI
jgi:hypothetical protein